MIVAHIMGLPIEESALQLAPASAALATAVALAGRIGLSSLRRRLGRPLRRSTNEAPRR